MTELRFIFVNISTLNYVVVFPKKHNKVSGMATFWGVIALVREEEIVPGAVLQTTARQSPYRFRWAHAPGRRWIAGPCHYRRERR